MEVINVRWQTKLMPSRSKETSLEDACLFFHCSISTPIENRYATTKQDWSIWSWVNVCKLFEHNVTNRKEWCCSHFVKQQKWNISCYYTGKANVLPRKITSGKKWGRENIISLKKKEEEIWYCSQSIFFWWNIRRRVMVRFLQNLFLHDGVSSLTIMIFRICCISTPRDSSEFKQNSFNTKKLYNWYSPNTHWKKIAWVIFNGGLLRTTNLMWY